MELDAGTLRKVNGFPADAIVTKVAVGARGDPHLVSVVGEKFDMNQPGKHVLIRIPEDRSLPAKLQLNSRIDPSDSSPCGPYIQKVQVSGAWLEGQVVSVQPLRRNVPGSNGAGDSMRLR